MTGYKSWAKWTQIAAALDFIAIELLRFLNNCIVWIPNWIGLPIATIDYRTTLAIVCSNFSYDFCFPPDLDNSAFYILVQLATHKNAVGVAVGATIGHTICTSLAVVGGSMLASKISQRTVATFGGLLFLGFSLSSYFYPPLW